MSDKEFKRQLIMATKNSPAYIQCKVQKIVEKRPLIDLSQIKIEEDRVPTFEELMAEGIGND